MRRTGGLGAAALVTVALSACSPATSAVTLPPDTGGLDYQLGGAYPPDPAVGVVARDRTEDPVDGAYSICYVNGFQTQPGEFDGWPDDLLLHDAGGAVVLDPAWPDEALLDTSSGASRDGIVEMVAPWIEGCAASGFDAVEFDNLDTYTRSGGALAFDDNLALARRLVEVAHAAGLAAGQKNAAEDAARLHADAGFDFAVTEECAAFDECDAYTDVYGTHVLDIEYADGLVGSFDDVCADADTPTKVVLRDRDLRPPDDPAHVFELCGDR